MLPINFLGLRKFIIPEIVYGTGAIELAGRHASNLGASKVMICTDKGVSEAGWTSKIIKSLEESGLSYIVYSDITPNPKDYEVMRGAEYYQREKCDLIVAVGGGSPMDCAKGIGVIAGNGGLITDYKGIDSVPLPGPPLVFIPTTAGSSADISQFAIITDTNLKVKIAIVSKMVIPDIALVDPQTTITMTPELTAETGMDALCHAFEAYVSSASSPLTDMSAVTSVRLIRQSLFKAYECPENLDYRNDMMMASLMAGLAFSNASLGLVHAMAHSLGGFMGLPHGKCNAILLEHVVNYNYESAVSKYENLAKELGIKTDQGSLKNELISEISDIREKLGIKRTLGISETNSSVIKLLTENAYQDPCMATNPKPADRIDIEKIFRNIF